MSAINDSILDSTKAALGIVPEYDHFDGQLILYINTAFSTLWQIGLGPQTGFAITGHKETWNEYLNNNKLLNMVKTYVHMSVRLMFDPPTSSFALDAMKKSVDEYLWRINVMVDPTVITGEET